MITTDWIYGEKNLDDSHRIRQIVFIEEQNVPKEIEFDNEDENGTHLLVYDGKTPVGTGRIIIIDDDAKLGRIAVLKEHRGNGYGDLIVRMLVRKAFDMGYEKQMLNAQISAKGLYEKAGFEIVGDVFEEAGIPHVKMIHIGDISGNCK